ncbi:MAG: DMT family transporter [Burkholderiaceae bacterium]|nr:DMT family transporter [Burkholderiaceae bacterium]
MSKLLLAHGAAAASALSAGAAVVATRFVIGEADPVSLVLYRYAIAVACFLPFLPGMWPKGGLTMVEAAKVAAFGLLFFVLFPWAFNASLQYVPAARGAVGLASIPIQTMLVAALFGRERATAGKVMGAAIAFAGIVVAYGIAASDGGAGDYLAGDALMLLGATCAATYSVFSRGILREHGPIFVTALGMASSVAVLLPAVALTNTDTLLPHLTAKGWFAVLFLGSVAGALQFSLFMWALRWLPPSTTVLYLMLNPVSAMALGVAVLGERVTPQLIVGLLLVIGGVLIGSGVLARRRGTPE